MLTFGHCLICFKCDPSTSPTSSRHGSEDGYGSIHNGSRKNSEICGRFCTLASRYLNLNPEYFFPGKTIRSKFAVNITHACDDCATALESFCERYQLWNHLQLELNGELENIGKLMRAADKVDRDHYSDMPKGEIPSPRDELKKKLKRSGRSMDDIKYFRKQFLKQSDIKTKSVPSLKLRRQRSHDSDSNDDLFVAVRRKVKKSRNKKESSGEPQRVPEIKIETRESDYEIGVDKSSSDDDDLFIPVRTVRKKRPANSPVTTLKRIKTEPFQEVDIVDILSTSGVSESSGSEYTPPSNKEGAENYTETDDSSDNDDRDSSNASTEEMDNHPEFQTELLKTAALAFPEMYQESEKLSPTPTSAVTISRSLTGVNTVSRERNNSIVSEPRPRPNRRRRVNYASRLRSSRRNRADLKKEISDTGEQGKSLPDVIN